VEVAFTERQSHQHGLKRASGEDFKISISRSGGTSAFSRVASGGAERTGSSVSETKPETLRPQLSIQNFPGYKLDEECGEYDVLRVEHLGSERDNEYNRERGTHRKKKDGAGGAQVPVPANYSYKVHLALCQNSSASNGGSSGGNFRWQSSDLMNGRRRWSSAKGEHDESCACINSIQDDLYICDAHGLLPSILAEHLEWYHVKCVIIRAHRNRV
jgi:hypothetical protein